MTNAEFSRQFDVRFNNIDSNLAHSVTEYEKSLYLTQAQTEIVKNYINPKGNKYQEGYDGSPKRHIDLSAITVVEKVDAGTTPPTDASFGFKSLMVKIQGDVMQILNERFVFNGTGTPTVYAYDTTVVPIDYKQYQIILGKAYKDPPIRQTWRFVRSGDSTGKVTIELIPKSTFDTGKPYVYSVRYLKHPAPIVLETFTGGLTIQGVSAETACALSPEIHEEILARACEIAKGDFLGELDTQMKLNTRNE
jgi:hypothetical protein